MIGPVRVRARSPTSEHQRAGLFALAEIPGLAMPAGYERSISG
jgi:hypothetical protein